MVNDIRSQFLVLGSQLHHRSFGSASWPEVGHPASDLIFVLHFSSDLCWTSFSSQATIRFMA
jgi:hypothetical protein